MEMMLIKIDGKYIPWGEGDREKSDTIKDDEIVKAKISRPRNPLHHRKYFALLDLVFKNLPHEMEERIKTVDILLFEIKLNLGLFDQHTTTGGKLVYIPQSISFGSMEQPEFETFYSDTISVILKHFLKGTNRETLEQEVLNFM